MPATLFQCPDGQRTTISDCLNQCRLKNRCMFLPTLRAVARSLNRNIQQPTVTELIAGTRETYLKRTMDYAVEPQSVLYALHGSALHTINEGYTEGNMLSEMRLHDEITSGKFDLYGQIAGLDECVLGDIKVTSSYKIMKALGRYKVDVPTGEVYKTGAKKGQPKYAKEWRDGGVRGILDWAIQLNYYRILLEQHGFPVRSMVIQALCRDNSLRIASERGIDQAVYLLPIHRISDRWILRYMRHKAKGLQESIADKVLPDTCTEKERWHNRKCHDFCQVAEHCPHGQALKENSAVAFKDVS